MHHVVPYRVTDAQTGQVTTFHFTHKILIELLQKRKNHKAIMPQKKKTTAESVQNNENCSRPGRSPFDHLTTPMRGLNALLHAGTRFLASYGCIIRPMLGGGGACTIALHFRQILIFGFLQKTITTPSCHNNKARIPPPQYRFKIIITFLYNIT